MQAEQVQRIKWGEPHPAAVGFAVFVASVLLLAVIQFATPALAGTDGYYHIKVAQLMRLEGLRLDFRWLPLSILDAASYYDHHFLWHAFMALFIPDAAAATPAALITAAKLASVIMPAAAFTAIWWALRGAEVRWAWLWALGLFAVSDAFLFRMSMPRAQSGSLLVLALALGLLWRERYVWLLPLGFFYVWLYNAFPLLLLVVGAHLAALLIREGRLAWQPLMFALGGIALGLLVNPYFPQNLEFIARHLLPKLLDATAVRVGNEWYPYETWTLAENSGMALLAMVGGTAALAWRGERIDAKTLAAFGLAVATGVMLFRSRRFVEYFPAFALIFAALSAGPLLVQWFEGWPASWRRARLLVPLGLAALIGVMGVLSIYEARGALEGAKPAETYADASAWLVENSQPGSLVFQTDWDDFPRLFFYNTHNIYTIGLDVTYMTQYDEALYDEWAAITRGDVEEPGAIIAEHFGASYVISDLRHGGFMRQAEHDPWLHEVYRDEYAVIYSVAQPNS